MSQASTEVKLRRVNDLLRSWDKNIVEESGCWSRGNGKAWAAGEPQGLINHHLVVPFSMPPLSASTMVRDGHSTLAGPLANWYVHDDEIRFIAARPANHAGPGDNRVLQRAAAGLPYDGTGPDNYNGNPVWLGQEAHHPGDNSPWPTGLIQNIVALNAAVCIAFGWNEHHCINHKWHSTRKVDMSLSWPGTVPLMVQQYMDAKTAESPLGISQALKRRKTEDDIMRPFFFTFPSDDQTHMRVFLSDGVTFRHVRDIDDLAFHIWRLGLLGAKPQYITDGRFAKADAKDAYVVATAKPVEQPAHYGVDVTPKA